MTLSRKNAMNSNYWQEQLFAHLSDHTTLSLHDPRSRYDDAHVSGAQLVALAEQWGSHLRSLGMAHNTAIVLPMRLDIQSVAVLLGAWQAALFPILIKPATPPNIVAETLERAGGGLLVASPAMQAAYAARGFAVCGAAFDGCSVLLAPGAPRAHPRVEHGNILGILTSGSTGRPKVVVQTLRNVMRNARMHAASIGLDASDTVALSLPLNFSAGLVAGLFGTLMTGAKGVLVDGQRINARKFLDEFPVSVCMATPGAVLQAFSPAVLSSIRALTVGGDILHPQLALQLVQATAASGTVYATYGMSEAGPRIATARVSAEMVRHYNAVPLGAALEGVTLALNDSASNGVGELLVTTPTAMYGYLYDAEGTRQATSGPGGALRSGDLFRREGDDYIFVGRQKRIIVRGGENIFPAYVESTILNLYGFDDVWVTAESHHTFGQVPKAYLLSGAPIDLTRLARELRAHLPLSHIPALWEVVTTLPAGARK